MVLILLIRNWYALMTVIWLVCSDKLVCHMLICSNLVSIPPNLTFCSQKLQKNELMPSPHCVLLIRAKKESMKYTGTISSKWHT